MDSRSAKVAVAGGVALVAVLAALAIGWQLRWQDPASNPVIPAEDPYTHMLLVREHLRDGRLDPQNDRGALYPPGLHAVVATLWVYSGLKLEDIVRAGPVVFGLVGIAGIAALLWRFDGPLAAFVGALAMATMPEAIFRTDMMSPTALDLALLPFLFWSVLELVRGNLRWLGAAVPLCLFLVVAHPWLMAVLALAGLAFLMMYLVFPWRATRGAPITREGAAAAVALVGGTFGLALATRWSASGTGFSELTLPFVGNNLGVLGLLAVLAAGATTALLLALPAFIRARLPSMNLRMRPTLLQVAGVVALAALLAAIVIPAVQRGTMPPDVDLPRMIGWPALALAAAAFILIPLAGGPAAHLAGALFLTTLPLTIYNPLDSPFWPSRTVVFMALGVAILAGVAAQRAAEGWGVASQAIRRRAKVRPMRARSVVRAGAVPLVATLVVAGTVSAGILTVTPEPYPGGWYRYYNAEEFAALKHVADLANRDPRAVVLADSWESGLVVGSYTDNASRVWFKVEAFRASNAAYRDNFEQVRMKPGTGPTYAVVDRYLSESPDADAGWLAHDGHWTVVATCCAHQVGTTPRLVVYQLEGGG